MNVKPTINPSGASIASLMLAPFISESVRFPPKAKDFELPSYRKNINIFTFIKHSSIPTPAPSVRSGRFW